MKKKLVCSTGLILRSLALQASVATTANFSFYYHLSLFNCLLNEYYGMIITWQNTRTKLSLQQIKT